MSDLFPDRVISEILTRLPCKSVCRFKSVSKRWASLIGNPKFITAYLNRHGATWVKLDRAILLSRSDPIGFTPVTHSEVYTLTVNPRHLLKPDEPLSDPDRKQVPVTGYLKKGNQIAQQPTNNAEIIHVSNGLVLFALWIDPDPFKDGMDEYGRRPWRTRWEKALPGDPRANGNPEVAHFFIFSKDALEDVLFVANPVTREWARIPRPPPYLDNRACFGFVSDPTRNGEEFVIGVFECNHGSKPPGSEFTPKPATLTCFSSRVGKWVTKDAGYELSTLLGTRMWRPSCRFMFDGKMFWCDVSFGIVCWDEDPFIGAANVEDGGFSLVFVTLPSGRVEDELTLELVDSRCVDSGMGGCIQYMELLRMEGGIEVWRLKDYRAENVEWELVYRVVKDVLKDNCVLGLGLKVSFVNPTNPDVVVLESVEGGIFTVDVRNQTVESYNSFIGHTTAMPFVLPSFPPSLPPPLYADYAKEQGNGCFKGQNFKEAIAWYSRSISVSPSAVAYGNRAMAHLKVGRYREAEEDSSKCLDLDDRYFKGYARRARARKALGDLNGALEDVKFALTLEPKSEDTKELYDEVKYLLGMESCSDGENDDGDTTSDDDDGMDGEYLAGAGDGICNIGIDGYPSLERIYI